MLWVLIRIASGEAILMSTHNVCFYGEIKQNYPSIIIKYPPYLFFWGQKWNISKGTYRTISKKNVLKSGPCTVKILKIRTPEKLL